MPEYEGLWESNEGSPSVSSHLSKWGHQAIKGLRPTWQEDYASCPQQHSAWGQEASCENLLARENTLDALTQLNNLGHFPKKYPFLCWWRKLPKFHPSTSYKLVSLRSWGILRCIHFSYSLGLSTLLLLKRIISGVFLARQGQVFSERETARNEEPTVGALLAGWVLREASLPSLASDPATHTAAAPLPLACLQLVWSTSKTSPLPGGCTARFVRCHLNLLERHLIPEPVLSLAARPVTCA